MVAEKNMGLYFNIKKTLLKAFDLVDFADADEKNMELLDFLYSGFDINDWGDVDTEENETVLKQCLSVLFEHYPSLSANHMEKVFVEGIHSSCVLCGQASMAPLYAKLMENEGENGSTQSTVSVEKGLVKEFKQMAERLESVDKQPEEELLEHRAEFISGMGIDSNFDANIPAAMPQTPAPLQSTRPSRSRRRGRHENSSGEGDSSTTVV
ncbi:hypothetical protein DKX38_027371 [Salix brachista]|uniref:Uncharacterized protein n=1 Tax=Salix brachista TaxID=2182728 RepID=A0A5N5JGZ4_9ROSI|nr:hypothetical protein DKX38_027371 [Salix brachista]